MAMQNYLAMAMTAFSGRLREAQLTGTLEAELVTPVPLHWHLLGSASYAFLFKTFHVAVYVALGCLLGGVRLHWARIPQAFLVLLLAAAAFSCLGILSAATILVLKKGDPLGTAFQILSWLLGGVYFPVSLLPSWLRWMGNLLPMGPSLEALRTLLLGGAPPGAWMRPVGILALWTLAGLPLSCMAYAWAVAWARRRGTLGQY
jgi:ABC-2 type transport system permease protein